MHSLESSPLQKVRTGTLEIEYVDLGPPDGDPAILLHGFPYDIHSLTDVAPLLADAGRRALVPFLRGHGGTVSLGVPGARGSRRRSGRTWSSSWMH